MELCEAVYACGAEQKLVMTRPEHVPLHARSCEQSVEMCPHGSPSAEAVAQDPANSADSFPACDPARNPRTFSREAAQVCAPAPSDENCNDRRTSIDPALSHENHDVACWCFHAACITVMPNGSGYMHVSEAYAFCCRGWKQRLLGSTGQVTRGYVPRVAAGACPMGCPATRSAQKAATGMPMMLSLKTATELPWGRSWLPVPNRPSQKVLYYLLLRESSWTEREVAGNLQSTGKSLV